MMLDYGVYAAESERLRRISQENQAYNERNLDRRIALDQANRARTQQLALQQGDIAGRRQLAADQYGYNYALEDQRSYDDLIRMGYGFQHQDALFEKEQAGRMAEQELQNLQAQQMAQFQAGQMEQRDFRLADLNAEAAQEEQEFRAGQAQFQSDHQMALQKMIQEGQAARDKILQDFERGNISESRKWEAEKIKEAYRQEVRQFTDKSLAEGVMILPDRVQAEVAKQEDYLVNVEASNMLTREQKDEIVGQIRGRIEDLIYENARPPFNHEKAKSFEAKVNQQLQGLSPAQQQKIRPFIVPGKDGSPSLMSGFRGSDLLEEKLPQFVTEDEKRVLFGANYEKFKDAPMMRDPATGKATIDKGALDYEKFQWEKEHPKEGEGGKPKKMTQSSWLAVRDRIYKEIMFELDQVAGADGKGLTTRMVQVPNRPGEIRTEKSDVRPLTTMERHEAGKRMLVEEMMRRGLGTSYEEYTKPDDEVDAAAPQAAPRKFSPSGKYEWDGQKWIPVRG